MRPASITEIRSYFPIFTVTPLHDAVPPIRPEEVKEVEEVKQATPLTVMAASNAVALNGVLQDALMVLGPCLRVITGQIEATRLDTPVQSPAPSFVVQSVTVTVLPD